MPWNLGCPGTSLSSPSPLPVELPAARSLPEPLRPTLPPPTGIETASSGEMPPARAATAERRVCVSSRCAPRNSDSFFSIHASRAVTVSSFFLIVSSRSCSSCSFAMHAASRRFHSSSFALRSSRSVRVVSSSACCSLTDAISASFSSVSWQIITRRSSLRLSMSANISSLLRAIWLSSCLVSRCLASRASSDLLLALSCSSSCFVSRSFC
mmetsp:Transcript_15732/g.37176  ORF Transcript_15732/g.37176 Transcript_15732/m.37176 type:complete len:211 (-) Transcript_15732:1167-1799(-)